MPFNPGSILLETFERHAARPFLIDAAIAGRSFTYGEVFAQAGDLAGRLRALGVGKGGRVGILLDNSLEFACAYFACFLLGATVAPINPALAARDRAFLLEHAGLCALLCSPATADGVSGATGDLPRLCLLSPGQKATPGTPSWGPLATGRPASPIAPETGLAGDDPASLTFTSGTTGLPKGVVHGFRGLLGNAQAFGEAVGLGTGTRFYHVLPMAYMAGFLNLLLCPFLAGASVVVDKAFAPAMALRFWEAPRRHGVTAMWLVPTILAMLLQLDRDEAGAAYAGERLDRLFVGTAPLSPRLKTAFAAKYGVSPLQSFGLSETLILTTERPGFPFRAGCSGAPLPGVSLNVAPQEDATQILAGEAGELLVRTPFLMQGYLDFSTGKPDPDTAPPDFPTGDIGFVDAAGDLYVTDRKKDLIIRGGFNLSPRQVEEVLESHAAVEQAAVVGAAHELLGEEVVAVLRLAAGARLDAVRPELDALCRRELQAIAVPARYMAVQDFPRSSTGKIQKNLLRVMVAPQKDAAS